MKNKEFVGIDVSKNVLDVFILSVQFHFTVTNSPEGFAQLLEIVSSKLKDAFAGVFFCFENTGRYSRLLSVFLHDGYFEGEFDFIKQRQESMLSHLQKEIELVDNEIYRIVSLQDDISTNYNLLRSIPGIGKVLAVYLIALTHNFKRFDTPRGRNKMSTINIIRNKLVFRTFAIMKRGTPYVDLHKFAA